MVFFGFYYFLNFILVLFTLRLCFSLNYFDLFGFVFVFVEAVLVYFDFCFLFVFVYFFI